MSLTSTTTVTDLMVATGSAVFPYTNIPIELSTDLEVYVNGALQLTSAYTVQGVGDPGGGTITFVTGSIPAVDDEVLIRRNPPLTQTTTYPESGPFPASSHEQALDKLTKITQTLTETDGRSLKWQLGTDVSTVSPVLPDPVANAGKVIGLTTTGTSAIEILSTDIASPLTQKGGLIGYTTVPAEITPGSDNDLLVYNSANSIGFSKLSIGSTLKKVATTQGDILYHDGSNVNRFGLITSRQMYGSDNTDLVAKQIPWAQGQCQLVYTNTTTITLKPYNGNIVILKTGSTYDVYEIPSSGVTGDVTTILAGSPLVAGTLYYIYLYNNSGTLTLVASTTAADLDVNTGFPTKSDDKTRLLVGVVQPNAGPVFAQGGTTQYVRSWFNDTGAICIANPDADYATASTSYLQPTTSNRCFALTWSNEHIIETYSGSVSQVATLSDVYVGFGIDSTTVASYGQIFEVPSATVGTPFLLNYTRTKSGTALQATANTYSVLAKVGSGGGAMTLLDGASPDIATHMLYATGRKQ